jgi:hypothetical protein
MYTRFSTRSPLSSAVPECVMAPPRALNFVPTQFSTWRWLLFSSSSPQVNVKRTLCPTFGSRLIVYFDFGEVLFAVGGGGVL